jgi:hypothetical protein
MAIYESVFFTETQLVDWLKRKLPLKLDLSLLKQQA